MKKTVRTKYNKDSPYNKVIEALNDSNYKFRTISGVARTTNLQKNEVNRIISERQDEIVQLSRKNQKGEKLYTTRTHYNQVASIKEKLIGVFLNGVY